MTKKYTGDFIQTSTFSVGAKKPIDDRLVVKTVSSLFSEETWKVKGTSQLYSGIIVSVVDDSSDGNNIYMLPDNTKYAYQSWDTTASNYDANGWMKIKSLSTSFKYGASLDMTIDSSTYIVTIQLKDQDGNNLGEAKSIDLPLESVVVNGSYNDESKKIQLTLQNGSTIDIPVGDLVEGLQTEITSSNKLSADLVSDGDINKVYTSIEKTKLSNIEDGAQKNVNADWNSTEGDSKILNKPTIPTKTSELTNDSNFITLEDVPAQVNADWNATEGASKILNKPTIPTKTSELTNDSNFITSEDIPTIPTKTSELTNDSNFITSEDVPAQVNADWNATEGVAKILNKPEIKDSRLPDATASDEGKVLTIDNNGNYILEAWVNAGVTQY